MWSAPRGLDITRVSIQTHNTHVFVGADPELRAPEVWVPDDMAADYKIGTQQGGYPGYWEISGGPTSAGCVGSLALRLPAAADGARDLPHGLYVRTEATHESGKNDIRISTLRALSVVAVAEGGDVTIEEVHADSLILAHARPGRVPGGYFGGSATIRRSTARGYGVMAVVRGVLTLDRVGSHTSSTGMFSGGSIVADRCLVNRWPKGWRDIPGFHVFPAGLDDPRAHDLLFGDGKLPD